MKNPLGMRAAAAVLVALALSAAAPAVATARGASSYDGGWGGYAEGIATCDDDASTTTCDIEHTYDLNAGLVRSKAVATASLPSSGNAQGDPGLYRTWTTKAVKSVTATFTVHVDTATVARSADSGYSVVAAEGFLSDEACATTCSTTTAATLATTELGATPAAPDANGNIILTVTLHMADGSPMPAGKVTASLMLLSFAGSYSVPYLGTDSADATIHVLDLGVTSK